METNKEEKSPLNYRTLCDRLAVTYGDADEARDIALLLLERAFGFTLTDVALGRLSELSTENSERLEIMTERLERNEPVQYVLGEASFCGRTFVVNQSVLIPRPETEELCQLIISDWDKPFCGLQPPTPLQLLDVGTGSGCIAITLRLGLPCSEVTAWDVSADALITARENGHHLNASVNWQLQDALHAPKDENRWDIIVSNPPYIIEREREDMRSNVLDHEPNLALFVPDNDPLRFYRAITRYAVTALRPEGRIYFEINPLFVDELIGMMHSNGFASIDVFKDFRGKKRIVRGGRQ